MARQCPPQPQRSKPPLDGWGPRGDPQCYYTSRVNLATARYERFVKKLRKEEEETKRGELNQQKEMLDKKNSLFFITCDRRANINRVARRVDLCLKSYDEDLEKKRGRLREILDAEEKENIRKFVEQAQAGSDLLWQDKVDRMAYLLDKRKKEMEKKYKDTPLSKCTHISSCISAYRCQETKEFQKYQMRENQARKMQEREFDRMWHEVAMKECEAMSARMEVEAIQRKQIDCEWKQYNESECERKRRENERMKELQKKEDEYFMSIWESENKEERDKQQHSKDLELEAAKERQESNAQNMLIKKQKDDNNRLIDDTWARYSVTHDDEAEKEEIRRQKEREQIACNSKVIELRKRAESRFSEHDHLIEEVRKQKQLIQDIKRQEKMKVAQSSHAELMEQIKYREKVRQEDLQRDKEELEYSNHLSKQMEEIDRYKEYTEKQTQKQHQKDLLDQIAYNKLLKERQKQEDRDQYEKAKKSDQEYVDTMAEMLARPAHSEGVHPFQKVMMKQVYPKTFSCPCKKTDWCKEGPLQ